MNIPEPRATANGLWIWRVVHRDFAKDPFSGEGARRQGGRYNPPGVPAIYVSPSLALAVLEVFVHIQDWSVMEERFVWFRVRLTHAPIHSNPLKGLSAPAMHEGQRIGAKLLADPSVAGFEAPSAVLADSHNIVLSPVHPTIAALSPEGPFSLSIDPRLIGPPDLATRSRGK